MPSGKPTTPFCLVRVEQSGEGGPIEDPGADRVGDQPVWCKGPLVAEDAVIRCVPAAE